MLLQDLFASSRPHSMHNLFPKSAVHYSYYLKPNNVIGQRETTDIEIWIRYLTKSVLVHGLILANDKQLL